MSKLHAEAVRITQEIVQIANTPDLGDFRDEMITRIVEKNFAPVAGESSVLRLGLASLVAINLSTTLTVIIDEFTGRNEQPRTVRRRPEADEHFDRARDL